MNNESHESFIVGQPATITDPKQSGYSHAIVVAMTQQAIVLVLAALMLDGGRLLRAFIGALVVPWAVTLLVMLRYPERPTPLGAVVVKYGWIPGLLRRREEVVRGPVACRWPPMLLAVQTRLAHAASATAIHRHRE